MAAVACAVLAGCGAQQAVEGPINAIQATDVVVESNLQAAQQAAQTEYVTANSYSSFGTADAPSIGKKITLDPSRNPGTISYAVSADGQSLVLASYNKATENCYGIIQIAGTASPPILGETGTGTYDFEDPHIISTGCDAGRYMSAQSTLPGWPAGDPAVSPAWPK